MKRLSYFFLITVLIFSSGRVIKVYSQGRGHGRGHGSAHGNSAKHHPHGKHANNGHEGRNGHGRPDWSDQSNENVHHHHSSSRTYDYSYPVYHHQHDRSCNHHVIVRNYTRPRYVYYRDYDVYYDCHREVYISYGRQGWTMTASLPSILVHVDLSRAVCHEVQYYDDDFVPYIDSGRPIYGSVVYLQR
jgi:hypothetical protein